MRFNPTHNNPKCREAKMDLAPPSLPGGGPDVDGAGGKPRIATPGYIQRGYGGGWRLSTFIHHPSSKIVHVFRLNLLRKPCSTPATEGFVSCRMELFVTYSTGGEGLAVSETLGTNTFPEIFCRHTFFAGTELAAVVGHKVGGWIHSYSG